MKIARGCLWLLIWPISVPVWLWRRGKVGKILAALFILIFIGFAATASPPPTPAVEKPVPPANSLSPTLDPTGTPTDTPLPVPIPTDTSLPVPIPTDTPLPVPIPTDTPLPVPIPTDTPLPTASSTLNSDANLRAGPGTEYAVVGQAQQGQAVEIVAKNVAGDWYQLADGTWIAAFLVNNAPGNLAVAAAPPLPTQPPGQPIAQPTATPVPALLPTATFQDIALLILVNSGRDEVLGIRNNGGTALDISGWRLDGSLGDDFCIIPGGTTLQPGEMFTVATGDSQPQGRGYKCGAGPIWNNDGETIYLRSSDGQVLQIISG